jgi:hypothetical protein
MFKAVHGKVMPSGALAAMAMDNDGERRNGNSSLNEIIGTGLGGGGEDDSGLGTTMCSSSSITPPELMAMPASHGHPAQTTANIREMMAKEQRQQPQLGIPNEFVSAIKLHN